MEEETEKASEGSAPEGKTAFKIAVLKHTHNMGDDFNEQLGFQTAEEATGIHIEWISVSDGSAEKVNAMLTADLPDAFLAWCRKNRSQAVWIPLRICRVSLRKMRPM